MAKGSESKKEKNTEKADKSGDNQGEIDAKMSARSGQGRFKGGQMDKKRANGSDSNRNGLVYA